MKVPRRRSLVVFAATFLLASRAFGAPEKPPPAFAPPFALSEQRAPCSESHPLRHPYFGDLHVHTAFSQDASTQGTRNTPRDAYRFARGAPLGIQPYGADGQAVRTLKLARPLDFAAVTDHAELLGETHICASPDAPGGDSWVCSVYRRWPRFAFFLMNYQTTGPRERFDFCGENGKICLDAAATPWAEIQAAAEGAYDRTADCSFTTFVAYEWTGARDLFNLHRNVIFRNDEVPKLPTSFYEAETGRELWQALERDCVERDGRCDALVIPHNSNLSGGLMFQMQETDGSPMTAARAAERARSEPLVEVMQHKGDSECLLGAAGTTDEQCGFEKLPYDGFVGKFLPLVAAPPPAASFIRGALGMGLAHEERIGENPFQFGLIASTDTHLATPGAVDERRHPGHGGAGTPARDSVPSGLLDNIEFSPGGLAVLWAEENSRDALFESMRRREAYGTSGPRMILRFFAGWEADEDLCTAPDRAARSYAGGVPMGGVLPPGAMGQTPHFSVWAARDPEGLALQRIQIVKGWRQDGESRERVFEVAGNPQNGADVDLATCAPRGEGADALCRVWSDPEFDPQERAFYYARVLENPSCRWSAWACLEAGVVCSEPATIGDGFEPCCADDHRWIQQERAWSSPIWFVPDEASAP